MWASSWVGRSFLFQDFSHGAAQFLNGFVAVFFQTAPHKTSCWQCGMKNGPCKHLLRAHLKREGTPADRSNLPAASTCSVFVDSSIEARSRRRFGCATYGGAIVRHGCCMNAPCEYACPPMQDLTAQFPGDNVGSKHFGNCLHLRTKHFVQPACQ